MSLAQLRRISGASGDFICGKVIMRALRLNMTGGLLLFAAGRLFGDVISVSSSSDAMLMAQSLAGNGVTITSATLLMSNGVDQQGLFSGGAGTLPFSSGIALTSGSVNNIPGPNNAPDATQSWSGAGYAALEVLNGGSPTFDANVLTMTFIPTANQVSFQYVFGSEEYNEWVVGSNLFNDVFAFYLNGVNIALIPGTLTPVDIDSVNCASNPAYYLNNDPFNGDLAGCSGSVTNPLNIQYDGLVGVSTPLFATGFVTPNQVNTIVLAIADSRDGILDSGVMIAANSFQTGAPPNLVPEPAALLPLGACVAFLLFRRYRTAG
jgi:hypothetical protein